MAGKVGGQGPRHIDVRSQPLTLTGCWGARERERAGERVSVSESERERESVN